MQFMQYFAKESVFLEIYDKELGKQQNSGFFIGHSTLYVAWHRIIKYTTASIALQIPKSVFSFL